MFVVKELWHGRSAREPFAKDVGRGMWRSVNELMLVRYGFSLVLPLHITFRLFESHKSFKY